jgi:glutamine cyclotransferase
MNFERPICFKKISTLNTQNLVYRFIIYYSHDDRGFTQGLHSTANIISNVQQIRFASNETVVRMMHW